MTSELRGRIPQKRQIIERGLIPNDGALHHPPDVVGHMELVEDKHDAIVGGSGFYNYVIHYYRH